MKHKTLKLFPIFLFYSVMLGAQLPASESATDTSRVFPIAVFQQLVLNNHPVVRQAKLLSEAARADVLQSLGKFDPLIEAGFNRKEFGNRDYYSNWSNQLKIPLWVAGADLKIGYDRYTGENVNPQYITPDQGLTGVGIAIPLGQGFVIDARRNTLRQSRAMLRYAEAERIQQILFVWNSAINDYWSWYVAYSEYMLLQEGVQLAATRFAGSKGQTEIGDTPPIDTIEAKITVQERQIELAKLRIELNNRRLLLSNNIWDSDGNPLELPAGAIPEQPDVSALRPEDVRLDSLVGFAAGSHPDLLKMRADSTRLAIERSFRREMLKPTMNLSGMLIAARDRLGPVTPKYYDFAWRNYKVGVDVAFPLFLRAERGKLREVTIRQDQLRLNLQQTNRDIRNEILTAYNTLNAYKDQLSIQVASIDNQQRLLDAEVQKFQLGESTLFLVNSRETKLIDMKIKRVSMVANFQKTLADLYYKAGTGPAAIRSN